MGTEWPEKPKRSEGETPGAEWTDKRKRSEMMDAEKRRWAKAEATRQLEQFGVYLSSSPVQIPAAARNILGAAIVIGIFLSFVALSLMWGSVGSCVGGVWMMACFMLIPAALIAGGFAWWWMGKRHFGPVEFTLSAYEVRRGDRLQVQYRQGVRSNITIPQYALRLVLRETVRYTRGTDTVTEHYEHVVSRVDFEGKTLVAGEQLAEDVAFEIPAGAMHSFDQPNNKLRWYVVAEIRLASWPHTLKNEIEFTVLAEGRRV